MTTRFGDDQRLPPEPSRRNLLAGALGGIAGAATTGRAFAAPGQANDTLRAVAARKGVAFGSEVSIYSLRTDPTYRAAVARDCEMVIAGNEMKMEYVEPERGRVSFKGGDETRDYALANGLRMRGTTLVWYAGMPAWAEEEITPSRAERFMRDWITRIAGRYRGQIDSWDTVNEIVELRDGRADGLRNSSWLRALGTAYVDIAFETLREVDPHAAGLWNEEDVCQGAAWMEAKRTAVLRLLEMFLRRGVPIRRFGLQSHLNSLIPIDEKALRRFLARIAGMGLAIELTEFDVDDRAFPPDHEVRDRGVADIARRYLDVVLDEPAVLNVITWDYTDRNTWLNDSFRRRPDGVPHRSLPLDAEYRRKPLWYAIRDAFAAAPDYSGTRAMLKSI